MLTVEEDAVGLGIEADAALLLHVLFGRVLFGRLGHDRNRARCGHLSLLKDTKSPGYELSGRVSTGVNTHLGPSSRLGRAHRRRLACDSAGGA